MFLNKEKESRVKFNPGLSANGPLNNWAKEYKKFLITNNLKLPYTKCQY